MKLSTLETIFRSLDRAGVRYLVAGGVAVNAHGYQRLTQDLDLVVDLSHPNLTAALRALAALDYRPLLPVSAESFADPRQRSRWIEERNLQVFSLVSDRFPGTTIDLFASEPFDFVTEHDAAMVAELAEGLEVRFVRLATLIAMKQATGRPRDRDDAEHLAEIRRELGEER